MSPSIEDTTRDDHELAGKFSGFPCSPLDMLLSSLISMSVLLCPAFRGLKSLALTASPDSLQP
jgi:hypothetical protein